MFRKTIKSFKKRPAGFLLLLLGYVVLRFIIVPLTERVYFIDYFYSIAGLIFPSDYLCCNEKGQDNNSDLAELFFFENSIFFHETSCGSVVRLPRACSIESAARAHPDKQIVVFFTSPIPELSCYQGIVAEMLSLPNIDISRISVKDYFVGTPLEKGIKRILKRYKNKNMAELLKFVTLYKFGGVVMESDLVSRKPLDALGSNWVVKGPEVNETTIDTAVIAMDKKHTLGRKVLGKVIRDVRASKGHILAKKALTYAIKKVCLDKDINSTRVCYGISIYPNHLFIYNWTNTDLQLTDVNNTETFGYRLTNFEYDNGIPKESAYAKMAKEYCPSVYNRFIYEFIGK